MSIIKDKSESTKRLITYVTNHGEKSVQTQLRITYWKGRLDGLNFAYDTLSQIDSYDISAEQIKNLN
jgi:hypothetical protein